MLYENVVRCSSAGRLRSELRTVEDRAVAIRKLLSQLRGRLPRGEMSAAMRLVRMIEALARHGRTCNAEDAVEILAQVDVIASVLGTMIDGY